jgi:hypothetical protein
VKDAVYFYNISPNPVNSHIGQTGDDKLARVDKAAGSATPGKLLKRVDVLINGKRDAAASLSCSWM